MTISEALEFGNMWLEINENDKDSSTYAFFKMAVKALKQEPCEDVTSRILKRMWNCRGRHTTSIDKVKMEQIIRDELLYVNPQPKTGYCKECKYFEYDSFGIVDGIPLIVAHEICSRWGNGCKTSEDGHCFLFEPQEGSDKE